MDLLRNQSSRTVYIGFDYFDCLVHRYRGLWEGASEKRETTRLISGVSGACAILANTAPADKGKPLVGGGGAGFGRRFKCQS